ncbi:MAG: HEAT repeat domain-containing protein [Candidatus Aminicenantes bacterium]|nr:HEAT repeat domain-containing protein [Candidatus Aminicenantes bacterium]
MKRQALIILAVWLLAALLIPAAESPTAKMFNGQVRSVETGGLSLKARSAEACRQSATASEGVVFFTAWAFPAFEPVYSCQRHHGVSETGLMSIKSRNGRIVVNSDRDHSLTISDGQGKKKDGLNWGVLIFLNRVEKGRCRVIDMKLLAPDREYDLGGERLAWLGTADEVQGLEFIRGLLSQEPDRNLRKDLVFALYLFHGSDAVSELIGLARRDPDPAVRKDAIFWLGQKASAAAIKALGEVIASPEALDIKKHAVFALSQLPEDKGTPMLMQIARKNPHPRLRKEAIFWLGQSGDPSALDFFEEILLK